MVEVVVVGGGIGGLAAAFAQARAGRTVRVLERSAEFGEVGAGLQLGPNATRVLHRWGLLDQVIERGVLPGRLVFRDALTGEELTHLDLGEGFRRRYGGPYVVAHRGDLHAVLLRACAAAGVELLNGRHVERVDAGRARAHCAGGEVHEGDVVVAADGLQSVLRAQLVADQPHDSGFVAYRGTRPLPGDFDVADVVAYLGPDCHFVQYALRGGELLNQVAVFRGPGDLEPAFDGCCEAIGKGLPYLWRDRHCPCSTARPSAPGCGAGSPSWGTPPIPCSSTWPRAPARPSRTPTSWPSSRRPATGAGRWPRNRRSACRGRRACRRRRGCGATSGPWTAWPGCCATSCSGPGTRPATTTSTGCMEGEA